MPLRRLVCKTLARQFAAAFLRATAPFQFALSTRAGTECVAHLIQSLTQANPEATVLSIDGIGAFDLMSRNAMLQGLADLPAASSALPFCGMFYGSRSQYLWTDQHGDARVVEQAEGGEQGDPLMPALFALGQHPALQEAQAHLLPGEHLFAFLDDIYVICEPDRARTIYDEITRNLQRLCGISVNQGKTKVWNKAGERGR